MVTWNFYYDGFLVWADIPEFNVETITRLIEDKVSDGGGWLKLDVHSSEGLVFVMIYVTANVGAIIRPNVDEFAIRTGAHERPEVDS